MRTIKNFCLLAILALTLTPYLVLADAPTPLTFTFDSDKDLQQWKIVNGGWSVSNGILVAKPVSTALDNGHVYMLYTGDEYSDVEIQADVYVPTGGYHHPALMVRAKDANNHYICRVNEWSSKPIDGLQLFQKYNPNLTDTPQDVNWTHLDSNQWSWMDPSNLKMKEGTWYTMKLRAEGDALSCRMWERGTTEPTKWALQKKDTTFVHGMVGLETYKSEHNFDNVIIKPLRQEKSDPGKNIDVVLPTNSKTSETVTVRPVSVKVLTPIEEGAVVSKAFYITMKKNSLLGHSSVLIDYRAQSYKGNEDQLAVARYNTKTKKWVPLKTTVYRINGVAKTTLTNNATYALLRYHSTQHTKIVAE